MDDFENGDGYDDDDDHDDNYDDDGYAAAAIMTSRMVVLFHNEILCSITATILKTIVLVVDGSAIQCSTNIQSHIRITSTIFNFNIIITTMSSAQ
ncbi:hypothetical protein PoB_005105900 [Plakobranchus ocellatus]|uniref:Uncharacterized protein n=1 Tax=Plakobranchus ocellatus TaxID=259542 RepID=A0AAV4C1J5_9GAST|nr:hypothetical protein PoB_005105900 [Plakobranchus ocellatus]